MQFSDQEVIRHIRNGNATVYEALFKQYYDPLCRFAASILSSSPEAEGMVQELFLHLWDKRAQLEISSSLKSYLFRSTRNKCLNHLKHLKVRDKYLQEKLYVQPVSEEMKEESENLEAHIYQAIGGLPNRCREIFELSRFEGLKYREIADILGISPKTVEVQMGKALKILRKKLKPHITFEKY